jgi:hypothetical protein
MGKLSIPSDTKGLYDNRAKQLTVFVGERAFVSFTGTPAEVADVYFAAAGYDSNDRVIATYKGNATTLFVEIDTTSPSRLSFESANSDGKALAPTIEILVRMRPDYDAGDCEGQVDPNACWAACTTWWLTVTPGRQAVSQLELLKRASGMTNRDGTINAGPYTTFAQKNGFRMRVERIQPRNLSNYLGYWPLIIGFKAPGGFGHMNVLYGRNEGAGTVDAMEPWAPDPSLDNNYTDQSEAGQVPVYASNTDGSPFVFTGDYVTRQFSYYLNSPLQGGYFLAGYPAEYRVQI